MDASMGTFFKVMFTVGLQGRIGIGIGGGDGVFGVRSD